MEWVPDWSWQSLSGLTGFAPTLSRDTSPPRSMEDHRSEPLLWKPTIGLDGGSRCT